MSRGQLMVSNAQLVGYPRGAQVFLNLEDNLSDGVSPTTRAGIIQWVQNWAAVVKAAGYMPGVYVGNPQILSLSANDLTSALTNVSVFWWSASGSAPQSARGYVMRQPSIFRGRLRHHTRAWTVSVQALSCRPWPGWRRPRRSARSRVVSYQSRATRPRRAAQK